MKKEIMLLQDSIQTVNKQVDSISNSELIDVYKEIINSQNQTYNILIFSFIAIIALFAGATWLYNRRIVKGEIKRLTKEIYLIEKKKILKTVKKEFEKELNLLKAEKARLFAVQNDNGTTQGYIDGFVWWIECIRLYKLVKNELAVSVSVQSSLEQIKLVIDNIDECSEFYRENYLDDIEEHIKDIDTIPDYFLNDKKEIKKLFNNFIEHCNK